MKFITYILIFHFSVVACIPRGDFSQLAQLDDLYKHYQLHLVESLKSGQELSFGEFLYIHFIDGDKHQHSEENDHKNLPLVSVSSGMLMFVDQVNFIKKSITILSPEREILFRNPFYKNTYINQVFHPPSLLH